MKIANHRPVYVTGTGMHKYQFPSETPYVTLGLTAVRAALEEAGINFSDIEGAYVGCTGIGMAAARVMFNYLGSTGLACTQVENASASGSSAFRQAVIDVASGVSDIALAVGVDKYRDQVRAVNKQNVANLSPFADVPLVHYALLTAMLEESTDLTPTDLALVASKNHTNASHNPYAQFQKPRSVEAILASNPVAGSITSLMCCPRGEGAAAAIVMSEEGLRRLGNTSLVPIRVASSVLQSERHHRDSFTASEELARRVAEQAYADAAIDPSMLDVVELHDAFAVEEILYTEAFGLCPKDGATAFIRAGETAIGGSCAVNPSGGLIGMGHPLGPTGIGQICEISKQLRGTAGPRQQPDARWGMAHMMGLGTIAIAHILCRE